MNIDLKRVQDLLGRYITSLIHNPNSCEVLKRVDLTVEGEIREIEGAIEEVDTYLSDSF